MAPEITPVKGLDIKPMYSYFTASGTTSGNARQSRGGISTTTWFQNSAGLAAPNDDGSWRKGINEDRHTVGIDARYRMGPFSLDPTVLYQFGNLSLVAPTVGSGNFPVQFLDAGVVPGRKYNPSIDAWLADVRAGYQLGPLLLSAMTMWTTGQDAKSNPYKSIKYYQALNTDTGYMNDWGTQIVSLGIDYYQMLGALAGSQNLGNTIGWDKYGRYQFGARATYAFTPALSVYGGVNYHRTDKAIQKNATPSSNGLIPVFTGPAAKDDSHYLGTELFAGLTWRFAPGLAWDNAGGYMFMGSAMDALTNPATGPRDAKDSYIVTSRIRFSF